MLKGLELVLRCHVQREVRIDTEAALQNICRVLGGLQGAFCLVAELF
jgi:hypothetical protein